MSRTLAGLLSSFIFISYIAVTSSMTLDLTELRNKISKIKVNPRGNLWATGHFMGKKSVVDSSFMESAFEDANVPPEVRAILLEEHLSHKLLHLYSHNMKSSR
uniref:Neuromedin Ba n=1 Tax=Sparus aurata TaxID=8175 RepID=A0A671XJZ8_SPAAU